MASLFRQYSWIVDLVAVLFCSFFLAKITSVYLGKSLEVKRSIGVLTTAEVSPLKRESVPLSEFDIIIKRNIFDPTERTTDEIKQDDGVVETKVNLTGEAVLTDLKLNILGVLIVGNGRDKRSSATVATGSSSSTASTSRSRRKSRSTASSAEV